MADAYWNPQQQSLQVPSSGVLKRPRSDYGTVFCLLSGASFLIYSRRAAV